MKNSIFLNLITGLSSAILFIAAVRGSVVGIILFTLVAPLPIIIYGLGWGWISALTSSATAAFLTAFFIHPIAGVHHLFAVGLPMVICSYLLMLKRETNENGSSVVEWYPPGRVLFLLTLIAGTLAAISLFSFASNEHELESIITERVDNLAIQLPDEIDGKNFASFLSKTFTPAIAVFWMAVACLNLWLGSYIIFASGLLARPWPDLSFITLPREGPLFMFATLSGSFLDGYPGLIALGFASAIFIAYLIIGLAIIHNITRKFKARTTVLIIVYIILLIYHPYTSIAISMLGIAEPILPIKRCYEDS
ncbi:MAG: hypothetical protein TECD_00522 [Hyphomicrobiaceae bacterium hypho_1]